MAGRPTYFRLYDHGRYMGEYRNSELMELLDIRHHQLIAYYSDTGREYKARYLIERIEEPMRGSWAAEWDHARLKVLGQVFLPDYLFADRNGKGSRLAGSCLGPHHHIPACQHMRQHLLLHSGGMFIP